VADSAAEPDGADAGSAFLRALGVKPDRTQGERLQQELEWFAHARVRAVAARTEPVDMLVEFLATTQVALPVDAARTFRAELASAVEAHSDVRRSPLSLVVDRLQELFGAPATMLAEQLDLLVCRCAREPRPLDSVTVRRLYAEASDLCDVWSLALREGLVTDLEPAGTADELYATEGAVLGLFDPADPGDIAERRLDLAELVRQLTELLTLDRWGLLPRRWLWDETPSLGWPAMFAQAQYRLRQIATVGPPARVQAGETGREPGVDGRHGEALHLLAALGAATTRPPAATAPVPEEREAGHQRVRRSLHAVMPWATRLQGADLAWALRWQPELMTAYGLGPADAAEETAALLPGLLACLRYAGPGPGPDTLPLNAWEMRERFPELCRLLTLYHEQIERGDVAEYRESQNPDVLPALVAEVYLQTCGASGRYAAALSGELAAFGLLFSGDEAADRALRVLGEQPRDHEPGHPWWDDLSWHAWLRATAAEVMRHAPHGAGRTGGLR
jgi:hypothetical protein